MAFVALDLETTGLESKKDKIIEVALVLFDENTYEILDTYSTLINPGIPIPDLNANITGIVDEDVATSPSFYEVKEDIEKFIGDNVILGHNVQFDIGFLLENGIHIKLNPFIDTFFLANFLVFHENSLNLESLCACFNIPLTGAHRALNDTIATIKLFQKLEAYGKEIDTQKKEMLGYIFSLSHEKNVKIISERLGIPPSQRFSQDLFAKGIIDILDKKYIFNFSEKQKTVISKEKYNDIIDKIPGFYFRENQKKLMDEIFSGYKKGKNLVVEAPTGLGKTVSYLIPSIIHSLSTGTQVIISTKTKALQDQIFYKDLKSLHSSLEYDFLSLKLKGKKNYFSLYSYLKFLTLSAGGYEEVGFAAKIFLWLHTSDFGELDDLNFYGKEFQYIKEVNSDYANILSESNVFREHEIYYRIKKAQKDANILVINHTLLFADIESGGDICASSDSLIIDEAHSIEDVATESLKKKYQKSILVLVCESILKNIQKSNLDQGEFYKKIEALEFDLDFIEGEIVKKLGRFFDLRNGYANTLVKDFIYSDESICQLADSIKKKLSFLIEYLESLEIDIFSELKYMQDLISVFDIVFNPESSKVYISMVNYSERGGMSLEYTYLNIGKYVQEKIWDTFEHIFLVSATLKIGDSFDYMKQTYSLEEEKFTFLSYESDFDYTKQAKLYIPNNIGSIKNNFLRVSSFIKDCLQIIHGNTLVLFTSYSSIKSFYIGTNFELKKSGTTLLSQGIGGSKFKIISLFKKNSHSTAIVGTESFWEGVDIPGDDLQYLFIHKFPFLVPSDPIFEARSKLYKDAFSDYSMPKAILKLKQGFGRLIRTKYDTGVVFMLDDRIFSTRWGKEFFKAFPTDIDIILEDEESIKQRLKSNINI